MCALDCPDACSLLIDVDPAGRGSKFRGNPRHPVTRGFLCGKVARYLEREYSPDAPAPSSAAHERQRRGPLQPDLLGGSARTKSPEKLGPLSNEFGSESILPYSYAGTMGLLNGSGMDRRFFHRLGASRLDRTICSSAGAPG